MRRRQRDRNRGTLGQLRGKGGALANYLIYYDTGEQVDLGFGTGAVNWGYEMLNKSLKYFNLPFQVLLFVIAFFI